MKRNGLVVALVLAALGSGLFASRLWAWVLHFDPGFVFNHEPVPTGSPLSAGVTILLVDGLRLDASRGMPTLNALRSQGADIEAQVGTPSFSRPGRATVAVGATPSIHGVTTNRQKREIPLDNIIRRVGALGGACRVAGSKIWPGLFGRDIEHCGAYKEGESKEGPGAFVRQIGDVRSAEEAGLAFAVDRPAMLRIADVVSTDFAAHEYGGTSPEYLAEVRRADSLIASLVRRLDFAKETLVVTADHGHRDQGGHGGEEPEVLTIPIVMVGAGIKPGATARASQADIAPTVATLLGATLPTATSGAPIIAVLALDPAEHASLEAASVRQRAGFEKGLAEGLGVAVTGDAHTDSAGPIARRRSAEKERRAFLLVPLLLLASLGAFLPLRLARPHAADLAAGIAASALLLAGPVGSRLPQMSFSAINYDEMLIPFLVRVMALAALTTLVASASAAFAGRILGARAARESSFVPVGSTGLLGAAVLGLATLGRWWNDLLLSPLTLPLPGRLVEAYSFTLATLSVALTTLAMLAAIRAVEAIRNSKA